MTKQIRILCEAKLAAGIHPEATEPTGLIEATVTTWGAREGEDGRKFFYTAEGFTDWANEFEAGVRPLPMFVNHSADEIPVGEWTDFKFTKEGMTASGRLFLNTSQGADLYKVMAESPTLFGGVSVGAYAEEFQWVKEDGSVFPAGSDDYWDEGYFQITKGGLREVSVVMYPNNLSAAISKLEFFRLDGSADLKVFERALRDAGFLKKDAATAASVFKQAFEQRDAVQESLENATAKRDSEAGVATDEILAALNEREVLQHLKKRLKG
ncbi:MAG: hypothetical protein WBI20_14895 [Burkholderiaceae bacterium]